MRDYQHFDRYLDRLAGDIYPQEPDDAHREWSLEALYWIMTTIYVDGVPYDPKPRVLDVGCGQGFMCFPFESMGFAWSGITLGEDVEAARRYIEMYSFDRSKVKGMDMTFMSELKDRSFDLVFARHVLEHSPFPILTLMEWNRVTKSDGHLCLVAPAPHTWTQQGKNHYSVVRKELLEWWLKRSGWEPVHKFVFNNREGSFLRYLEPFQDALEGKDIHGQPPEMVLERYPEGPVEFRYICKRVVEVSE
jgi:SAM-dependent methyltransferase